MPEWVCIWEFNFSSSSNSRSQNLHLGAPGLDLHSSSGKKSSSVSDFTDPPIFVTKWKGTEDMLDFSSISETTKATHQSRFSRCINFRLIVLIVRSIPISMYLEAVHKIMSLNTTHTFSKALRYFTSSFHIQPDLRFQSELHYQTCQMCSGDVYWSF